MTTRPVRDTSGDITRMVLLGTLSLAPAHGYEVKTKLERWDMHWWADVQTGAIYAGLKRLEREGLIERTASEREGNRPVRRIFRITPDGATELRRLLAEAWQGVTRFSRPIDVALSFYHLLSQDEIEEHLHNRLRTLKQLREVFEEDRLDVELGRYQRQMVPDLRAHERFLLDAEISFTEMLIRNFEEGAYSAR